MNGTDAWLTASLLVVLVLLELDVVDVPALGMHMGHGQREGSFRGERHLARLALRKLRSYPLGLPRLLWKTLKLELAARRRRLGR